MARLKGYYGALALVALAAGTAYAATSAGDSAVMTALKARLPNTALAQVDCKALDPLCEVTAGKSVFYVDRKARYLVIGHVFDMASRQDLTAARLLQINPEALLGGMSGRGGGEEELAAAEAGRPLARDYPIARSQTPVGPGGRELVSLAALPASGTIEWGGSGQKITIFTDFRCGYCRALTNQLETMDVHVVERPISLLGTRDLSNRVYCAKDRVRALRAAYAGDVPPEAQCDTSGLDANERFARDNGFTGTPVIVRGDGAVHHGYMPKDELIAWLKGSKS